MTALPTYGETVGNFYFLLIYYYTTLIVPLWIVIKDLFVSCTKTCCGSQPPRWLPMTQPPGIHTLVCHTVLVCVINNSLWQEWWEVASEIVQKDWFLSQALWFTPSLGSPNLEAGCHVDTQVSKKWSLHRNWGLPRATTVSLEEGPPAPLKLWDDYSSSQ